MSDLISRQAAIDALHMHLMYRMGTDSNKKRLDEWINGVPSAQPERKKGRWIQDESGDYKCSECGGREDLFIYGTEDCYGNGESNYCPQCGVDMGGEDDE